MIVPVGFNGLVLAGRCTIPFPHSSLDMSLQKKDPSSLPSVVVDREDDLRYDLGRLAALDPTPIERSTDLGPEALLRSTRANMHR